MPHRFISYLSLLRPDITFTCSCALSLVPLPALQPLTAMQSTDSTVQLLKTAATAPSLALLLVKKGFFFLITAWRLEQQFRTLVVLNWKPIILGSSAGLHRRQYSHKKLACSSKHLHLKALPLLPAAAPALLSTVTAL